MIKRKMKISEKVKEEIKRREFIWYGHMRRMKVKSILRIAMKNKPIFKRKRGRLRRTWFNGIRRAM